MFGNSYRYEATERIGSQRRGSKPKSKGWVGRTASEFAVWLTRTTEDFENSWKRSDRRNRQLNQETVSHCQKRDIPNFSERPSSFVLLSERERNRTKPN